MPDTPRTQAALLAAFADNTTGNITPQNARDLIVSGPIGTDQETALIPQFPIVGLAANGNWLLPGWGANGSSVAGTPNAGDLWWIPIWTPVSLSIIAIGLHVVVQDASHVRAGLYNGTIGANNRLSAGSLVIDFGEFDVSTTGDKSIANAFTLAAGYSFLAGVCDGTPTLSCANQSYSPVTRSIAGSPLPGNLFDVIYKTTGQSALVAGGMPTNLPAPFDVYPATTYCNLILELHT